MSETDALIVGGGLVGSACAVALAQQGLRVAVLDSKPATRTEPVADQAWDSRIYTISPGNAAWLEALGVWGRLDATRVCSIERMQIWGDAEAEAGPPPLQFDAYDANAANLGYVLENRLLQQALDVRMQELGIAVHNGVECSELFLQEGQSAVELTDGRVFTAALLIAADGANSWTREQAGLAVQTHDYGQMGVVANFATQLPHQNIARQWFRQDGALAWLPLPGQRMSMVWSTANQHAQYLLGLTAEALQQEVAAAGGHGLGELRLLAPAAAFPLSMQTASAMVRPALALIGDAAHQIHPLAGQGVNLGFRDVIALAQVLNTRRPPQQLGDIMLLRRYERARKADMLAMRHLTHGLHSLFDNAQPLVKKLRNQGLRLTNRQTQVKKFLISQALA